jgi:hypothetical protein
MSLRRLTVAMPLGMGAIAALTLVWLLNSGTAPVTAAQESLRPLRAPGDVSRTLAIQGNDILTSVAHIRRWNDTTRTALIQGNDILTPTSNSHFGMKDSQSLD